MDTFVQRFQPNLYTAWLDGKDLGRHPATGGDILPAPIPTIQDVLINRNNIHVPQSVLDSLRSRNGHHGRFRCKTALNFAQQYPDFNIGEIKARSDIPSDVRNSF